MNLPPIDVSGENVRALPVKPREATGDHMLVPVPFEQCRHWNASFTVDIDAGECVCSKCGGKVTPIFVLEQLMKQESQWMRTREAYLGEMKRLGERQSTKCQHCGKLTRISHR